MKNFLIFLSLSLSTISYSQNDFLPNDSASWTGYAITYCGAPNCIMASWMQVYNDTLTADSIVGSYSYQVLKHRYDSTSSMHYALYRADTLESQIWWIPEGHTQEYMFFDFDVAHSIGDTLSLPYYLYQSSFEITDCIIYDIDSTEVNGQFYKEWHVQAGNGMVISERLLNSNGFPFLVQGFFETEFTLVCYQESGVGLIGTCPWNEYSFGGVNETTIERTVLFPNPNSGNFSIKSDQTYQTNFLVYDLSGKLISSQIIATNSEINLNLTPGMYFYKVDSEIINSTGKLIIE